MSGVLGPRPPLYPAAAAVPLFGLSPPSYPGTANEPASVMPNSAVPRCRITVLPAFPADCQTAQLPLTACDGVTYTYTYTYTCSCTGRDSTRCFTSPRRSSLFQPTVRPRRAVSRVA